MKLHEKMKKTKADLTMAKELESVCKQRCQHLKLSSLFEKVKPVDVVALVRERVEVLTHWDEINETAECLKSDYSKLFEKMPHVDELPIVKSK
jgi:hypothetical protein